MPEEYGPLKLKVPLKKGDGAKAPQAFKEFADSIAKPPTGAVKQIYIVQSNGEIALKTLKGDTTLAEDGTLTIANDAVTAAKIATNAVGPSEIAPEAVGTSEIENGAVADTDLASPNNAVYRSILTAGPNLFAAEKEGTKYFRPGYSELDVATAQALSFYFAKADYEVGAKTQKLRIRAQLYTATAAPGSTLTLGMYPVTAVGGQSFTVGSVVSGSTVAFTTPSGNTLNQGNSGDFTIPADGYYIFGVVTSAKTAASASTYLTFQLQTRSV